MTASQAFGANEPVDGSPVRGLWWNPAKPGHGIDLHRQPGTRSYTMLWFTYDRNGSGTWYLGAGELDGARLPMTLLAFHWDGQAAEAEEVGEAEWVFSGHETAELNWRIDGRAGTEPLAPFEYALGLARLPLSGLWYDRAEPGWGLSLSTIGRTRVVIVYFYGPSGEARWAIGSGPADDVDVALLSFTGTCLGCAPREAASEPAGTVALESSLEAIGVDLDMAGPALPWRRITEARRLTEPLYMHGMPQQADANEVLAFAGVNVLPMHSEAVLEDHVVVTRDRLIDSVTPMDEAEVPQGAHLVLRTGAWLLPGLTDAHVHLPFTFSASDLFVFMAYGVTTIRNMWGNELLVGVRDGLAEGDAFAPRLFTASPGIESPGFWDGTVLVQTGPEARAAVSQLTQQGYDFIKIYNRQTVEVYTAIMEQSRALGIDPVGHVPFDVNLAMVLDGPQRSIEHLRGYPPRVTANRMDSWNTPLDMPQVRSWAAASVGAEVWNCPTQVALEHTASDVQTLMDTPAWRALSLGYQGLLTQPNTQPFAQSAQSIENERTMIRALAEAGAPLLTGTDAGIRFTLPGYSLHEELQIFAEAGVAPTTILRSATWEFARFMRAEDRWGSIQPGKEADLILVDGSPLEDVTRLLDGRLGVMVRGVWLSRETIDHRLAELASGRGN